MTTMKTLIIVKAFALVIVLLCLPSPFSERGRADEPTVDNVKDHVGDKTTDAKKLVRKGRQKLRKATGTDNSFKDTGDKIKDAGDDLSNGIDKLKRKTQ